MKFKYNPQAKKLWRIEDDYFYEIGEENRSIEHLVFFGTKISFKLGQNHWLTLHSGAGLDPTITVYYTKPLKNNEPTHYEKEINPGWFQVEIIFEFTEVDRVEKNEKGYWVPRRENG